MRILAIDLGDVRTGVSISDPTGTLAGRSLTLTEKSRAALIDAIAALVQENEVSRVVLGLPVNMDGSYGPAAQKAKAFGALLSQALGTDILYWDERSTSVTANRILSDAGKKRQRQRAQVDAVAAAIILQGYLDYMNRQAENRG